MDSTTTQLYNRLQMRFEPHEIPETAVPHELRNFYSKEVWGSRIPAIVRKASRYYKRNLEYTWLFLFIASSIAVPIAIYYVCIEKLPETNAEKAAAATQAYRWWRTGFDRVWRARLISFSSFIVIAMLFYAPIILWKHAGRSSVNRMLKKWENEDQAARPAASEVPHWSLGYIGIFGSTVKVEIVYPIVVPPSIFRPNAQLPSFLVNPPADQAAVQYYHQQFNLPATANPYSRSTWRDINPPRSARGVPLYDEHDEKAPEYLGPAVVIPPQDEEKLDSVRLN